MDPVAVAMTAAKDRSGYVAIPAMDVLLEHWEDPRSEQTLDEVAQGGPHWRGELGLTVWGEAAARLEKVRAKKQVYALFEGKTSAKEKLETIRQVYATNPPKHGTQLHSLLIQTAIEVGGGEAMDLVAPSSALPAGGIVAYVKKYPKEAIAFAQKSGCDQTLSYYAFLDALLTTNDPAVAGLLENCLKQANDRR